MVRVKMLRRAEAARAIHPLRSIRAHAKGPSHVHRHPNFTGAHADELVAVRRDLHMHPELGFREVRTAGIVAERLRALGLEPKTGVGVTGVTALVKGGKPGKTVLLRADMDALPIQKRTRRRTARRPTASCTRAVTTAT